MNPDNHLLYDFGILVEGEFEIGGEPTGWVIEDMLDAKLPRYLLSQPVLYLSSNEDRSVYIRGLYSERLTKKRRAARYKNTGVEQWKKLC